MEDVNWIAIVALVVTGVLAQIGLGIIIQRWWPDWFVGWRLWLVLTPVGAAAGALGGMLIR